MLVAQKLLLSSVVLIEGLIVYFGVTYQYPPSGDDYSYLYQAKLFAQGKVFAENSLYDPSQPLHDCIETSCLTDTAGRRFSRYPPGWPAILAIGARLGLPWIINPLLSALLLFLMLVFVEQKFGKELIGIAAALMTLCLFVAYYAGSFRAHIASALFVFAAFFVYEQSQRDPRYRKICLLGAGMLLGYTSLIRYLDCAPLAIWITLSLLRRSRLGDFLLFATGAGLVASGNLFYNSLLSGHLLQNFTVDHLTISWSGFKVTGLRLASLIGVFPVALLLLIFWRRFKASVNIRLYSELFLLNVAVYFFYTIAVGGPGPRYLLTYLPFLVLAVVDLYAWIRRAGSSVSHALWKLAIVAQVLASVVFAGIQGYTIYWRRDLERALSQKGTGKKLVFLRTGTYQTAIGDLTRNPPDLSSAQALYVGWCDRSKQRALLGTFPGREVFVYEFPGHIYPYGSFANAH
jgi:hypothetical protein